MPNELLYYDIVTKYKDIGAIQVICPLIDVMSKDEVSRFIEWLNIYCDQFISRKE